MAKLVTAIGLSLILATTAASAAPSVKPDSKKQGSEQKYCLTYESETGSRLARMECRTKREWRLLGVDVDQLSSSKTGNSGGLA
jgi:hypothetical protein